MPDLHIIRAIREVTTPLGRAIAIICAKGGITEMILITITEGAVMIMIGIDRQCTTIGARASKMRGRIITTTTTEDANVAMSATFRREDEANAAIFEVAAIWKMTAMIGMNMIAIWTTIDMIDIHHAIAMPLLREKMVTFPPERAQARVIYAFALFAHKYITRHMYKLFNF